MRLHLPEFRDQAYEIFLQDSDANVKRTALSAWASYYLGTNDKKVFKTLYGLLIDEGNHIRIRAEAYANIFLVCKYLHHAYDPYTSDTPLIKSTTHAEFNSIANWQAIEDIMREYAPEALVR